MKERDNPLTSCQTSMKLLGDYWTLRIVDALKTNRIRYCELQRAVDDLNPVTLTNRLKKLEAAGLVERTDETGDRACVKYSLTQLGKEVLPVIQALDQFSLKAAAA